MKVQRLDKIISSQLNISRSVARQDIRVGKVFVDGVLVRDAGFNVDPEKSIIKHCGQAVNYKKYIYIIMNKPKGVISASDDRLKKTVVDLVPSSLKRTGLFPVGRLDKDTTGLLIITDDGEFAHRVISPKKNIIKTYIAQLDGEITEEMIEKFKKGIVLADGTVCRSAELKSLGQNYAKIRISEGRYHQIKRMFGVVGLGVQELERVALGGLYLPNDLSYGECRELENSEKDDIFCN